MNVTSATIIGHRPYQEDRFVVREVSGGVLLAVADGHGGDAIAEFVGQNLERIFVSAKRSFKALEAVRVTFRRLHKATKTMEAGATLSIVWVSKRKGCAYVGVLGDSPVAIQNPGQDTWVAPDHNVQTNRKELAAAINRGALYLDGYIVQSVEEGSAGIQFSRTLGDIELDQIIDRRPELFTMPVQNGSVILLASDGIDDPSHQKQSRIEQLVWMARNGKTANDLAQNALDRGSLDNITAIVCTL